VILDEYTPQGMRMSAPLKTELLRSQSALGQRIMWRSSNRGLKLVGGTWTFFVEPGVSRFLPLPGNFGELRLGSFVPIQSNPEFRLLALRTEPVAMSAFKLERVEQTPFVHDPEFARSLEEARTSPDKMAVEKKYNPLVTLGGPTGSENTATLHRLVAEIEGGDVVKSGEFARRLVHAAAQQSDAVPPRCLPVSVLRRALHL